MAGQDRPHPIYSSLCEDPALQDAIDAFVITLAERVDELQDREARGDFAGLGELAEALLHESRRVGYGGLAACAETALGAARARNAEETRKAVVELTEIAQRVRLGHRGAV
jgi:hypothetical protein